MKMNEIAQIDKYFDLFFLRAEQTVDHEGDSGTNSSWCPWNGTKGSERILVDLEIQLRILTIQSTALLKSARIVRRVQETRGDLPLLRLH